MSGKYDRVRQAYCDVGGDGHTSTEAMRLCDIRYNSDVNEHWDSEEFHSIIDDIEAQVWAESWDAAHGADNEALARLVVACKKRVDDDELQVLVEKYEGQ